MPPQYLPDFMFSCSVVSCRTKPLMYRNHCMVMTIKTHIIYYERWFHWINTLNVNKNHSVHRPTGKSIHTWNQMHFGKVQSKMKSYNGTNYLSPRCKNGRFTHRSKQTNNQMYLSPHLAGCVCVRVDAIGQSRSSGRLVHAGVLSKPTGNDPHAGVLSKRPHSAFVVD